VSFVLEIHFLRVLRIKNALDMLVIEIKIDALRAL